MIPSNKVTWFQLPTACTLLKIRNRNTLGRRGASVGQKPTSCPWSKRDDNIRFVYSSSIKNMPCPTPGSSPLRADWNAILRPSGLTTGFDALYPG